MTECSRKLTVFQGPESGRSREEQIEFGYGPGPKTTVVFDAEHITSDAGLVALRQIDERFHLTAMAAERIVDGRWQPMVVHPVKRMVREAVYGFAAGYEDANDHTPLRNDPLYKQMIGPIRKGSINPKQQEGLLSEASQSRLFGRRKLTLDETFDQVHVDGFIRVMDGRAPKSLTLDGDGYDAETHGMQQLALFNGYYGQTMYYPLHVSAAEYGWVFGVRMRPGNASAGAGLVEMLGPIIKRLRAAWPGIKITVRGDSGMGSPELYEACDAWDAWDVNYLIRLRWNAVLDRLLKKEARPVRDEPDEWDGDYAVCYYETMYRAGTWKKARRVVFKLKYNMVTGEEENYAVVTNVRKAPRKVWTGYGHRGQEEQRIEEFKNDLRGEKMSCCDMDDNGMKQHLRTMAYNLYAALRIGLPEDHELKRATVGRLRIVLVKCGAMVRETARRLWLHASRHFPYRHQLAEVCRMALAPAWRSTLLWKSG